MLPNRSTVSLCRLCGEPLSIVFADLGMTPLANDYLTADHLGQSESYYPLTAYVCDRCFLVQLERVESPERIFTEYAYLSSFSTTWLEHVRRFAAMSARRFHLTPDSQVIEIGSNDGHLLLCFQELHLKTLGIEPAGNVAAIARTQGVDTLTAFFGTATAGELLARGVIADLLVANNVLAHVPDLNDFISGLGMILKPRGVLTVEVPHLLTLVENVEFDTIYHEHFSYFSLIALERAFLAHGLRLFELDELPIHGGSLRLYITHLNSAPEPSSAVSAVRQRETSAGLDNVQTYLDFDRRVKATKRSLLTTLITLKEQGASIAGYGAPAKGNTLLTYCGIGKDFLDYTVDRNPHKQGHFLPGTHIPIYSPELLLETKPDYVLALPWNFKDEIMNQVDFIRAWNGRFIVPVPSVQVL